MALCHLAAAVGHAHETANTSVTFDREVSRILSHKCLACHADRAIAFPLTSYEQARSWARAIEEEVLSRHMPPWRAVPGYGVFANDASLSTRELQLLVAWIEGNGPKSADQRIIANIDQTRTADRDRLRPPTDRWQLGRPAWVGTLSGITVEPNRGDHVRVARLATGFQNPTWVRGVEIRPADRRTVRAVVLTVAETGQWLGSWTPWHGAVRLPEGSAIRLPAGAHITVESHYRSAGEAVDDRTQVGLHLGSQPARCVSDLTLRASSAGPGRVRAEMTLTGDTRVLAMRPDASTGVRAFDVRARTPDGATHVLLLVKDPAPEWPTPYILKTPLALGRGTTLVVTGHLTGQAPEAQAPSLAVTVSRDVAPACGPASG